MNEKLKVKMLEKRILIVCFILSFGNVTRLLSVAESIKKALFTYFLCFISEHGHSLLLFNILIGIT